MIKHSSKIRTFRTLVTASESESLSTLITFSGLLSPDHAAFANAGPDLDLSLSFSLSSVSVSELDLELELDSSQFCIYN